MIVSYFQNFLLLGIARVFEWVFLPLTHSRVPAIFLVKQFLACITIIKVVYFQFLSMLFVIYFAVFYLVHTPIHVYSFMVELFQVLWWVSLPLQFDTRAHVCTLVFKFNFFICVNVISYACTLKVFGVHGI